MKGIALLITSRHVNCSSHHKKKLLLINCTQKSEWQKRNCWKKTIQKGFTNF